MSANRASSVLWREGMFLCPQHLQAFSREVLDRIASGDAAGRPGEFGLTALSIDEEALKRDVFRIDEVTALMRDGTLLAAPYNANVPQREFTEFLTGAELPVYLGVPAVEENVPQLGEDAERLHRYRVEIRQTHDENVRDSARELEFRQLSGHLFFGDEDRSGYECVPLALLRRAGKPAVTVVDSEWIAPALRCGAFPAIGRMLEDLTATARKQARDLAATLPDFTRLSSVDSASDLTGILKLQAVNRSLAVLDQLCRTPDAHPWHAYVELSRIVGELAIFGADRVVPELPAYDHGRPSECFATLRGKIKELLGAQVAVPYDTLPFEADASQDGISYAPLPDEWLVGHPTFYLGVELDMPQERAVEMVAAGVKLLSPSDLEQVLQGVLPGIALEPVRIPPSSFPKRKNLHFFRIETEGESRDYWLNLVQAKKAMVLSALGELGDVGYALYVELRP